MSDDTRLVAQQQRRDRARELILEHIESRIPFTQTTIAQTLAVEFEIGVRACRFDFNAVIDDVRRIYASQIDDINARIIAEHNAYIAELWDFYQDARDAGDRKPALDALKEIGKVRQLLAPDRVDVTVTVQPKLNVAALPVEERRALLAGIRKARELGGGEVPPSGTEN